MKHNLLTAADQMVNSLLCWYTVYVYVFILRQSWKSFASLFVSCTPPLIIGAPILSILAISCWSQAFAENMCPCYGNVIRWEQIHI